MDNFKYPAIPSGIGNRPIAYTMTVLPEGGPGESPVRPVVPPSPGMLQDVLELAQEGLHQPQGILEGWGTLTPGEMTSKKGTTPRKNKQETKHICVV